MKFISKFSKGLFTFITSGIIMILSLVSCSGDIDHEFAQHRAFFRYQYVATTPPLYAALNNPGMWCTISFPNGNYRFTLLDGSTFEVPPTALDSYTPPECINGFIVGMPNLPDFSGRFDLRAYDRVCPTCYEEAAIQRALTLTHEGRAECSRCHCVYDLNNGGLLIEGGPGEKLFRYRINYAPVQNILIIQN